MNKRKRKSKQSKTKHKSKHSMLFKIFTGGVLAFTGYNVYKLYSNWGAYRFAIKLAKYRNSPPMAIAYFSSKTSENEGLYSKYSVNVSSTILLKYSNFIFLNSGKANFI